MKTLIYKYKHMYIYSSIHAFVCIYFMNQPLFDLHIVGVFLSTYIWGYVCDAIGRRKVLLYGTFSSCALLFILMFVTSVWLFNIINLLSGIR